MDADYAAKVLAGSQAPRRRRTLYGSLPPGLFYGVCASAVHQASDLKPALARFLLAIWRVTAVLRTARAT